MFYASKTKCVNKANVQVVLKDFRQQQIKKHIFIHLLFAQ